jgi:peptidoglycan/xylan/chitin deacetylase (PgdA/CDA1 family)
MICLFSLTKEGMNMNSIRSNSFVQKGLVLTFLIIISVLFPFNKVKAVEVKGEEAEDNKIIYLTFDDGPSVMTDIVLDILKLHSF